MRKILTGIMPVVILALLSACATDGERGPSEDVILTDEAFRVVERARETYVQKDIQGLKEYFTDEGYSLMVRDVKKFESVELKFTPRWVEIKPDGTVHLQVDWEGSWRLREDWTEERDGIVTFILLRNRIKDMKMTSPFGQPEISSPEERRF